VDRERTDGAIGAGDTNNIEPTLITVDTKVSIMREGLGETILWMEVTGAMENTEVPAASMAEVGIAAVGITKSSSGRDRNASTLGATLLMHKSACKPPLLHTSKRLAETIRRLARMPRARKGKRIALDHLCDIPILFYTCLLDDNFTFVLLPLPTSTSSLVKTQIGIESS
jgi:hypothetical protein